MEALWAIGRYDLGLSEHEFWYGTTLRRLWLLLRRHDEAGRRADLRAGVLAAVVAQIAGNKRARPSDFFPALASESVTREDAMAANLENLKAHVLRQRLRGGR